MARELKVMLVYDNPGTEAAMATALGAAGFDVAGRSADSGDIAAGAAEAAAEVVVVGADAPSRRLLAKIEALQARRARPVALVAGGLEPDRMLAAVAAGVTAMATPAMAERGIGVVIDAAVAQFERLDKLTRERDDARLALTERKIIERAKGIVMRQRGLDEDAAYRFMREAAMNRNMKIGVLATSIVDTEELLN